jgi:hypothetical protein
MGSSTPRIAPSAPQPGAEERLGALRSMHEPAQPARSPMTLPLVLALCLLPSTFLLSRLRELESSLLGLLALPILLAILVFTLRPRRRTGRVELHQHGLFAEEGGARTVVVFDEVDELWIEQRWVRVWWLAFAAITRLRLVLHDGSVCHVPTEVEDSLALMRWILRACSDPLLPDARAALEAGETLTFGPIQLDREGLSVRGARARWEEIRLLRASLGSMALFRRRPVFPWRTIELDSVPHPTVFARLVSERVAKVERDYPAGWEMD